ncbi:MAG: ribbon-helix-helix domain-containing protein [Magnetospirillum sp.]|nr:ribbon-helix-helix domain-containing protein [Magnetospirillum sp.]
MQTEEVERKMQHAGDDGCLVKLQDFAQEKKSFRLHGRSTTVRMERIFWSLLKDIARSEGETLPSLLENIKERQHAFGASNLASCCRVICLKYCKGTMSAKALDDGILLRRGNPGDSRDGGPMPRPHDTSPPVSCKPGVDLRRSVDYLTE